MKIIRSIIMIKKTPYPLKKLALFYEPNNLSITGGTIESAIFQEPKLLEYTIKFPKGFGFPPEFDKIINPKEGGFISLSQQHSDKDEVVFTGLSSIMYSRFISENTVDSKINLINTYRFQLMLEQQSIISLVSVLETFLKSVQTEFNKNKRIYHSFTKIMNVLGKSGIKRNNLELLTDDKIYARIKEIIDYSFNLRNLYVHNGGIIDESFYKKYDNIINIDKIGQLIRVDYSDYEVIRQWLSFFIQEICRVIEGYDDVWTDYLLSTGIVLSDINLKLIAEDKTEYNIPLQDGVELIGTYPDEIKNTTIKNKSKKNKKTYGFELDVGKLIEKKISK